MSEFLEEDNEDTSGPETIEDIKKALESLQNIWEYVTGQREGYRPLADTIDDFLADYEWKSKDERRVAKWVFAEGVRQGKYFVENFFYNDVPIDFYVDND